MYYLENPLGQYEDMEMSVEYIPNYFMDTYILHKKVNNRYWYFKIQRVMYGLPQ